MTAELAGLAALAELEKTTPQARQRVSGLESTQEIHR
jgi:hypothetical protein